MTLTQDAVAGLVAELRQRLITVPEPGSKPFTPKEPFYQSMTIGGPPPKVGDSAGFQSVVNTAGRSNGPWLMQKHVYAAEPVSHAAADALEQQAARIAELEQAINGACSDLGCFSNFDCLCPESGRHVSEWCAPCKLAAALSAKEQ